MQRDSALKLMENYYEWKKINNGIKLIKRQYEIDHILSIFMIDYDYFE